MKTVQGVDGVWEMTWAPDGRATFSYGDERRRGHQHVIWRRIGNHASVLRAPYTESRSLAGALIREQTGTPEGRTRLAALRA